MKIKIMRVSKNISDLGIESKSKILIIMPHPDDETIFCGGLIGQTAALGSDLKLITITKGDASTNRFGLLPDQKLEDVREIELEKAAKILGVDKLEILDFPDSKVETKKAELKRTLSEKIKKGKPDFVITLEPWGCYGHIDHIVLSQVVTEIYKEENNFDLIYATVSDKLKPKKASKFVPHPEKVKPIQANFVLKLSLSDVWQKLKAAKCHKSQFNIKFSLFFILKWIKLDMLTKEYFYKL